MTGYMDIENLRENEEVMGDIVRRNNISAFEVGDHIQITEKYDGANASIENVDGEICSFSRKKQLSFNQTLNGFYNFIQNKVASGLTIPENIVVFGEWSGARNKIIYDKKNVWLVFDIFNKKTKAYMPQDFVKQFCLDKGFEYIHELYNGPFISWDHCRTFCHAPSYGDTQEGVVVKNQSKLKESTDYFYLKIVNTEFKESMKKPPKEIDPEKETAKANAEALMNSIVTRSRIEKMLFKLRDEGIIGSVIAPTDMGTVAKYLPKAIYEDCMKEEKETMIAAGEYGGKLISSITMRIAREIVLGK